MIKIISATFVGLIIGFIGGRFGVDNNESSTNIVERARFHSEILQTSNTQSATQLQQEINQLKFYIATLENSRNAQTNSEDKHAAVLNNINNCESQINNLVAIYAEKDRVLADVKNIKSAAQYDTKLRAEFDKEERNESWASATESKFNSELKRNNKTLNIVISSINCRTTTCEIKIPVASIESKNNIMESLADPSFSNNFGFKNSSIKSGLQIENGEMTVYFSNIN